MSGAAGGLESAPDGDRDSVATSDTEVGYVAPSAPGATKTERYVTLRGYVHALTDGEPDWLANLANAAAAIFDHVPNLNWAGFYLMKDGELVLGPFQGRPACVRIKVGRGVCGAAVVERRTQVVPDVREFPGHIACDARSRSEIVVPIVSGGEVVGVLDLDSAQPANFDIEDRRALETIVRDLVSRVDWRAATHSQRLGT
ncbi:MAG TPA: GAF domain-containing protein [Trueperaceae bacterium]|nr:GAF domain-containing protein [Trueperaceae bacterium]